VATIVLTKKKAAVAPALSDVAALIDEIGALQADFEARKKQIKALEAKQKPYQDKLLELQALIHEDDEHDPDDAFRELGEHYQADCGKQGTSRSIADIKGVQKLLGDQVFYEVCSVTLKNLDDYLTPAERDQVLTYERGYRTIKISRRG
jgi:hypothetical protein